MVGVNKYPHDQLLVSAPDDAAYGDYTFGLEPLLLPRPGVESAPWAHEKCSYEAWIDAIRTLAEGSESPSERQPSVNADAVYWFRWITGHQVCFLIWRLIAEHPRECDAQSEEHSRILRSYAQAYSAMLLYSGSCSRATYHTVIRPTMKLQHPGFSGGWAPDYCLAKDLLTRAAYEDEGLRAALEFKDLVHAYVASRLVPSGKSLLQESRAPARNTELREVLYDNYFMTIRTDVSRGKIVEQFIRRLLAVARDVGGQGLDLFGPSESDAFPASQPSIIQNFVQQFGNVLAEVALAAVQTATS